jgi:hypothetical protein
MGLAEQLRKSDTKLTEAQAFTKVLTDPANRDLRMAEKAERRRATTEMQDAESRVFDGSSTHGSPDLKGTPSPAGVDAKQGDMDSTGHNSSGDSALIALWRGRKPRRRLRRKISLRTCWPRGRRQLRYEIARTRSPVAWQLNIAAYPRKWCCARCFSAIPRWPGHTRKSRPWRNDFRIPWVLLPRPGTQEWAA